MHPHNAAKGILLVFLLCGVADFVWGYVHGRSIVTGVIWVVLGVFGTAGYWLLSRGQKSGNESAEHSLTVVMSVIACLKHQSVACL